MNDIPIYIPTRGTVTETYDNLPDELKLSVVFFTDNIISDVPSGQQISFTGGIADKRQACLDHAIASGNDYMVMVDDDTVLYQVTLNDKGIHTVSKDLADASSYHKFYTDAIDRFNASENLALISDHSRGFINREGDTNTGVNKFCLHDLRKLKNSNCVYNRIRIFEDIDFYLQLFKSGYSVLRTKIISSENDSADYVDIGEEVYKEVFMDWQETFSNNIKIDWRRPSVFAGNKRIPVTVNIRWSPKKYSDSSLSEFL